MYPPAALVEVVYRDRESEVAKLRWLHLIVAHVLHKKGTGNNMDSAVGPLLPFHCVQNVPTLSQPGGLAEACREQSPVSNPQCVPIVFLTFLEYKQRKGEKEQRRAEEQSRAGQQKSRAAKQSRKALQTSRAEEQSRRAEQSRTEEKSRSRAEEQSKEAEHEQRAEKQSKKQSSRAEKQSRAKRSQRRLCLEYDSDPTKRGETWRCRYAFGYGLNGSD